MGRGIAQLFAQHGYPTVLCDPMAPALSRAREFIRKGLARGVQKGKFSARDRDAAEGALRFTSRIQDVLPAELIVEAAPEDLGLKQRIFRELDARALPEVLLATNTSSLSVSAIAEKTQHPERVLGTHFFNPPPVMKLVEVVRARRTDARVFQAVWDLLKSLGKTPVEVQDSPGFIVNRVLRPYYLEGMRLVEVEGAGIETVDQSAREVGGVPMGPFELMDFIGLDVNLAIARAIYGALGNPARLKPHPLQEALVQKGELGRKSGVGFYLYRDSEISGLNPAVEKQLPKREKISLSPEEIWRRLCGGILEEARLLHGEGRASEEAIDTAVRLGMRFPQGPFEWARVSSDAPKV